jgi:replicative DNA helicase
VIPAELKDKLPPHNAEAEQACIGAVLIDPESVANVLRFLRPEDFYVNANREVFAGVV